jgi:hypothetical protein|tara:strand:+ start:50 stop:1129 length:1080 start_codon:yes stop_codon:yes gene_type:complete
MADSAILNLNLQTTGSNSGTWGTITNENLEKLEQSMKGYIAVAIGGASTQALTVASGGTGSGVQQPNAALKFTGSMVTNVTVTCEATPMWYIIDDATTKNGYTLNFGPTGGTPVSLVVGAKHIIYTDGSTAFDVLSDAGNVKANGTLQATGDVTFNGGAFSFNSSQADKDAVFAGDTQASLLYTDASTDRVGIATASPATVLDVAGTFRATGAATLSSTLGVTGLLTASTLTATGVVEFDGGNFTFNDAGALVDARFEGDNDPNLLVTYGSSDRVGIGVNVPTNAKLEINQNSASASISCLSLDQDDIDHNFIHFEGTSGGASANSISSSTAEAAAKGGAIMINVNGAIKWLRFYDSAV